MTEKTPRTRPTESELRRIQDLLTRSTLRAVEFHEVHARRLDQNQQREDNEDMVDISMVLQSHAGSDTFGIRLVTNAYPYRGEIVVAVAAEYSIDEGEPADEAIVRGFGNEVAVMTLLPYAREAVSTLSARVFGKPVLLPTIERGQVGFDLTDYELS